MTQERVTLSPEGAKIVERLTLYTMHGESVEPRSLEEQLELDRRIYGFSITKNGERINPIEIIDPDTGERREL